MGKTSTTKYICLVVNQHDHAQMTYPTSIPFFLFLFARSLPAFFSRERPWKPPPPARNPAADTPPYRREGSPRPAPTRSWGGLAPCWTPTSPGSRSGVPPTHASWGPSRRSRRPRGRRPSAASCWARWGRLSRRSGGDARRWRRRRP